MFNYPICHCGTPMMTKTYDPCSQKRIPTCPKCHCRIKQSGELEPNMFCGMVRLGINNSKQKIKDIKKEVATHYNQNLAHHSP